MHDCDRGKIFDQLRTEAEIIPPTEQQWYWLSFADETGFLGGCAVQANFYEGNERLSYFAAIRRSHSLGINPGGEVAMVMIPSIGKMPEKYREVLLDKATIKNELGGAEKL